MLTSMEDITESLLSLLEVDEIDPRLLNNVTTTLSPTKERFRFPSRMEQKPDWIFVVIAFLLFALATLFCIGSAVFLIVYRKNTIISLSQPRFLCISFLGGAVVAASGFCLLAAKMGGNNPDNTDEFLASVCTAGLWGFVIGHNVVYMALFGKLWRIQKVCRIRRGQTITVQQTIWPLRVVLLINIGVLTAWSVVTPPQYVRLERHSTGVVVGTCDFSQPGFFLACQVILIVSAALGLWMAYKTRKLPADLNDGGRIFHVFVGNAATFAVAATVYWVGDFFREPDVINSAITLAFFFTAVTSVAPIAVPKMYYVWYQKKHGRLPEGVGAIGHGNVHVTGPTQSSTQTQTEEGPPAAAVKPEAV